MNVEHLNPEALHRNPVFTQGIVVPADRRMLLIGGQNAVDQAGEVVAKGNVAGQTRRALDNLVAVLEAAGAGIEDLVKVTVILDQRAELQEAFPVWMEFWGGRPNPPTVSVFRVAGLAAPDFLIEVEAQAVLP